MRCGVRGSNTIILVWAMRGGSGKVTTMVARSLLPEASHDTSVEAGAKEARIHPCKAGLSLGSENQAVGPNSTSTGVGVLTSVLNLSRPLASWMRNTAMLSVFWFAA